MLYLQSEVARERFADMLRAAEQDRRIRAALSDHEDPVPARRRRFRRSRVSSPATVPVE